MAFDPSFLYCWHLASCLGVCFSESGVTALSPRHSRQSFFTQRSYTARRWSCGCRRGGLDRIDQRRVWDVELELVAVGLIGCFAGGADLVYRRLAGTLASRAPGRSFGCSCAARGFCRCAKRYCRAGISWDVPAWLLFVPVTLLVVWMTNLFNFMDGMDGFAGGMGVIGFGDACAARIQLD